MKTKIQIKNYLTNEVLFEYEKENNTIKDTLEEAIKQGVNIRYANLRGAKLVGADIRNANLVDANLEDANLWGANLRNANLRGANLVCAKNIPYIPIFCPSDGAFIGWKKVSGYLIKLLIPEDAKRSSATTEKCRCDKAKVLDIRDIETNKQVDEITNRNYVDTTYKIGEMVYPDSFDDNRWNECSHGIHFFVNKQDAINYMY